MIDQLAFDAPAAIAAGERGMQEALRAERVANWRLDADSWLEQQWSGKEFTADDLTAVIGLPDEGVYRNNSVGAWFGAKSKAHVISWTGRFRRSARVIGHGNPQRVWRVMS
jgi:hypothetical protein